MRAMMGLVASPSDAAKPILRAQLRSADALAPLRHAMNVFGLLFIWRVFDDSTPMPVLLGWSTGMLASTALTLLFAQGRRKENYAKVSMADLRLHGLSGLLHGMLWGSSMLLFPREGHPGELMALWTLISCVMVTGAMTFATSPLAAIGFLVPAAAGALRLFDAPAQAPLRALAIGYALALLVGCLMYARTFARQHRASVQLEEKSEVVSLLLREYEHGTSDWLWQTDAARRIGSVSARFAETLGLDPQALEGAPLVQILAGSAWEGGRFAPGLHELADRLKQRESFSGLVLPVDIKGAIHWLELSASPRFDDRGMFLGFRGVGSDITVQRESTEKIAQLARFDPLTGLPNRAHLHEALDAALTPTQGKPRASGFLMIDLDRFKAINDTLGHQIGDKLLGQVAQRLRQICSGTLFCGRIGGDEFGVLIREEADHHHVARLAKAIIGTLSMPYQVDQHTLYVGACVGSAIAPSDGRTSEGLIRSADLALYRAKAEGGGQHCAYEPQLHALAEERRLLELALREALDKDQLHVLYQPVVEAQAGTVVGFEALVRWTHPELGVISPAKFVPVAEEARLIAPIGEWVLRTACMEAATWPEDIRVAVNVSAEQLNNPQFVSCVLSALAQSGLDARRLELEVTESVFMNEDASALRVLDQILALGVQLSLDDFGTGYSSLGYLSRTKFSTIKIDRSFVVGAAANIPESMAIVRAVVTLAESLGMTTTAEGVETEVELAMVNRLGCNKVQGFYFGRPMAAQDAARLFPGPREQARA